jgi:hypothetical protein
MNAANSYTPKRLDASVQRQKDNWFRGMKEAKSKQQSTTDIALENWCSSTAPDIPASPCVEPIPREYTEICKICNARMTQFPVRLIPYQFFNLAVDTHFANQ